MKKKTPVKRVRVSEVTLNHLNEQVASLNDAIVHKNDEINRFEFELNDVKTAFRVHKEQGNKKEPRLLTVSIDVEEIARDWNIHDLSQVAPEELNQLVFALKRLL